VAELIGTGRCPIGCGSTKARYTLSAKKLTVGTCNSCNTQVFARSERSDEILRANIAPAAGAPAPAPAPVADPPPAPAPAADPPPAPARKRISWGMFAGQEV